MSNVKRKRRGAVAQIARRGNRVIIYVRISDIRGREDTLISDEVQIAEAMRLVKREGFEVVDIIKDMGKSGRTSAKRAIGSIISRVEAGEADGVVVWKISRWGRNTLDSLLNLGELQAVGGFLASATENLDEIDTPAGKFQLTLFLAVAQMLSDEVAKTWENIHDYRRDLGKPPMGGDRFGYVRNEGDYSVDESTGPWLRDAYRWYVEGLSLSAIAKRMREAGILTTRGNQMAYTTLVSILDSGFGAGKIADHRSGSTVYADGSHPAVIDDDLWTKYLRKRAAKVPPRTKHAPYRLAGLAICGTCGGKMHANWKYKPGGVKNGRYLRCFRDNGGRTNVTCPAPAQIDEAILNDMVKAWLTANAKGQGALDAAVARAQRVEKATADRGAIERKIAREHRRLSILADKVIDGDISGATARKKEAEIEAEIEALKASLDSLSVDIDINNIPTPQAFGAVLAGWDVLDPAVLNEGVRIVLQSIKVTKHPERHRTAHVEVIPAWEVERHLKAV